MRIPQEGLTHEHRGKLVEIPRQATDLMGERTVSKMKRCLPIIVILCGIAFAGCSSSEDSAPEGYTRTSLEHMGQMLQACWKRGLPVSDFDSLSTFLDVALREGYLFEKDRERFQQDYWKKPYRWDRSNEGNETIIRITSDGSNGYPEGGGGDDLYVEVRCAPGGEARMFVK
jgi:hypothetical protein